MRRFGLVEDPFGLVFDSQAELSLWSPGQTILPTDANSSQVINSKLASAGGQAIPPSRASLQENHLIVSLRPRSHITITKQLGLSWLELVDVAKRWKTWLELGENLSLIKSSQLDPTQANSSQVGGQTIPNSSKFWIWLELAWVGRTVWLGLKNAK